MTVSTAIGWPALAKRPRAPMRATHRAGDLRARRGRVPVRVTYPDGRVLGAGSPASPEFEVVRPAAFFARLGRDAKIGFGEAYMAGDWRAGPGTDLADLLTPFASRLTTLIPGRPCSGCVSSSTGASPRTRRTPLTAREPTSPPTTTSATTSSPPSWTRR